MKIGKRNPRPLMQKVWKALEDSTGMTTKMLNEICGEPVGSALDYTWRRKDAPLKRKKIKNGAVIWSITGPLPEQTSGPSITPNRKKKTAPTTAITLAPEANQAVDAITTLVAENQRLRGYLESLKATLESI